MSTIYKLSGDFGPAREGRLQDLIAEADRLHAGGASGVAVVAEVTVYRPRAPQAGDLPGVLRRIGRWNDGTVCVRWMHDDERRDVVMVTLVSPPLADVAVYQARWEAGGWVVVRHRTGLWERHLRRVAAHATAFNTAMAAADADGADARTLPVDDSALFPDLG